MYAAKPHQHQSLYHTGRRGEKNTEAAGGRGSILQHSPVCSSGPRRYLTSSLQTPGRQMAPVAGTWEGEWKSDEGWAWGSWDTSVPRKRFPCRHWRGASEGSVKMKEPRTQTHPFNSIFLIVGAAKPGNIQIFHCSRCTSGLWWVGEGGPLQAGGLHCMRDSSQLDGLQRKDGWRGVRLPL